MHFARDGVSRHRYHATMANMVPVLFALLVGVAGPALGQPLRSLVVDAEVGIAVPPRGAPPVPRRLPPPATPPPLAAVPLTTAETGVLGGAGLSAAVPVLPILAALLLGASAPGSGGGSAPATTR